jgi:hypothetical protein
MSQNVRSSDEAVARSKQIFKIFFNRRIEKLIKAIQQSSIVLLTVPKNVLQQVFFLHLKRFVITKIFLYNVIFLSV